MRYLVILCLMAMIAGCSSSQISSPAATQKQEPVKRQAPPKTSSKPTKDPARGPVSRAVEEMDNAKKEIEDALLLVDQARSKETVLDCRRDSIAAFQQLRQFFAVSAYDYNDFSFWFDTKSGEKVGVLEDEGNIEYCIYGIFITYKRVIALQKQGKVRTEFYVDTKTGELMVHSYRNEVMVDNKNYVLTGH